MSVAAGTPSLLPQSATSICRCAGLHTYLINAARCHEHFLACKCFVDTSCTVLRPLTCRDPLPTERDPLNDLSLVERLVSNVSCLPPRGRHAIASGRYFCVFLSISISVVIQGSVFSIRGTSICIEWVAFAADVRPTCRHPPSPSQCFCFPSSFSFALSLHSRPRTSNRRSS